MVKQLVLDGKRVVLMPIYKSFTDAFVLSYTANHFSLDMPFMFGNMEDTPRIKVFDRWTSAVGYIR